MQRIMPYATIQPPFTLKLREMPKKELTATAIGSWTYFRNESGNWPQQ
jgi:hypothetical protein